MSNPEYSHLNQIAVTGAAGFIGSNLVDFYLARGVKVIGIDNLSTGRLEFLKSARENENFTFYETDLLLEKNLPMLFDGSDTVFHLAANADVRHGPENPTRDLEQNTIGTHNVLEAIRIAKVKKFIFSSTGSVYGESEVIPTPENAPFPIQTSLYGASKLAGEGLVSAYAESFGIQMWIFRFVSILGPRYSHGHVYDFYKQLIQDDRILSVLGDGHQRKSYLHVYDCIQAINCAITNGVSKINIYNLGVNDTCKVRDSVDWITNELQLSPQVIYEKQKRGWIGDIPLIHLDVQKIEKLGWAPKFTIEESIRDTVKFLQTNSWIFGDND